MSKDHVVTAFTAYRDADSTERSLIRNGLQFIDLGIFDQRIAPRTPSTASHARAPKKRKITLAGRRKMRLGGKTTALKNKIKAKKPRKKNKQRVVLSEDQRRAVVQKAIEGYTPTRLSVMYNVSPSTIRDIVNRFHGYEDGKRDLEQDTDAKTVAVPAGHERTIESDRAEGR